MHPLFLQAAPGKPLAAEILRYRIEGLAGALSQRWRMARLPDSSVYLGLCATPEPGSALIFASIFDIPQRAWIFRVAGHPERVQVAPEGGLLGAQYFDALELVPGPRVSQLGYRILAVAWEPDLLYSPDLEIAMIHRDRRNPARPCDWVMSSVTPGEPDLSPFALCNLSNLPVNDDPGDTLDA